MEERRTIELGPLGRRLLDKVKALDAPLGARLEARVQAADTYQRARQAMAEVEMAYDFLSKGGAPFSEPTIGANGRLELRPHEEGERCSDYAVRPEKRVVNVEIKTPLPMDEKKNSNFRPILDEFKSRVHRLQKVGRLRRSASLVANENVLGIKGGAVGAFGKWVENEMADFDAENPPAEREGVLEQPLEYEGISMGKIAYFPSPGAAGSSPGNLGGRFDPEALVDRKQLCTDGPNVVVINLHGELLPTALEVAESFAGQFSGRGAFSNPKNAKISAVLVYEGNEARALLVNPRATHPLTENEVQFFERSHPPP